jgi:predicted Zn-dependent peptidase
MLSGESDDPQSLLEKIKLHIEKCKTEGLDIRDFDREKKCIYASYISDFDSTDDIAFALTSYANDKIDLFEYPDIIDSITFEYIKELLENTFNERFITLSVIK